MTESASTPDVSQTDDSVSPSGAGSLVDQARTKVQELGSGSEDAKIEQKLEGIQSEVDTAVDRATTPWYEKSSGAGVTVGLVSLLLVLRLFAVADWDWDVAASLADSFSFDDAFSIILGTLFERPRLSGLIVAVALPIAFVRDYWLRRNGHLKTRASNWFIIAVLIVTAYVLARTFGLWWIVIVTMVLTASLIAFGLLARAKNWHKAVIQLATHLMVLLSLAVLLTASTIDTPWVERERIVTTEDTIFGYVLQTDPGFLKILTEDRQVLILPDEDVVSRTLMPE